MDEIDGRCDCVSCKGRTDQTYQMRSYPCRNCRAGPFLLTFRKGDRTRNLTCPVCGNLSVVAPNTLVTAGDTNAQ